MSNAKTAYTHVLQKHWKSFFIASLIWTGFHAYLWFTAVFHYNPAAALEMISWDVPAEELDSYKLRTYAQSITLIIILTITTFAPLPYLLYLRFKRKGRV
tara:strand:- start:2741 stop:3040 length:300 start_codon:yes stop_codon:yes gene_type:complete